MDLSWLPDDGGTGHMPASPEIINFWKSVKEKTNFKKFVEIGFNAGHSSAILLTLFDDIEIQSYDIGQFDITHSNEKLIKEKFGDRFNLTIKDSTLIAPEEINGSDILFIDGGHDYPIVSKDMRLFIASDLRYVVVDDMQNRGVKQAYNEFFNNSMFKPLHRQIYTAVLPSWMRNDPTKRPVSVPVVLLRKQ